MTLDQLAMVMEGVQENGLIHGVVTCSYEGKPLASITITETKAAPDWTWEQLMDTANAKDISEVAQNEDQLNALLDELTDSMTDLIYDSLPEGMLN